VAHVALAHESDLELALLSLEQLRLERVVAVFDYNLQVALACSRRVDFFLIKYILKLNLLNFVLKKVVSL
jgi:hypothetical protein